MWFGLGFGFCGMAGTLDGRAIGHEGSGRVAARVRAEYYGDDRTPAARRESQRHQP